MNFAFQSLQKDTSDMRTELQTADSTLRTQFQNADTAIQSNLDNHLTSSTSNTLHSDYDIYSQGMGIGLTLHEMQLAARYGYYYYTPKTEQWQNQGPLSYSAGIRFQEVSSNVQVWRTVTDGMHFTTKDMNADSMHRINFGKWALLSK